MKKKAFSLLCVLVCAALCACAPARPEIGTAKTIFYGDDNGRALKNPLMGWSYYGFPEEIVESGIPEEFDVGIILCSWDRLEPRRGAYDFDLLTRAIDRLRQDGKCVYLRLYLMPDNVWDIKGYPDWVKDVEGVGRFTPAKLNETYSFEHPPYESRVYRGLIADFLEKVAETYPDGTADVIDSRAYGLYGEWDSNWGNYWDKTDPTVKARKREVLTEFVALYADAFSSFRLTKIAVNVSAEKFYTAREMEDYKTEAAFDAVLEAGFALRYDGIEAEYIKETLFFEWLKDQSFPRDPVYAETWFGYDTSRGDVADVVKSFSAARANIATFGFYQGNWQKALAYDRAFYTASLIPGDRYGRHPIGYRIYPVRAAFNKQAAVGGQIELTTEWTNTGAGVLYRPYELALTLTDESGKEVYRKTAGQDEGFDITELTYEKNYSHTAAFRLPEKGRLPAGSYTVRLGLADPATGKSAVAMPIGSPDATGLDHAIGKIQVL